MKGKTESKAAIYLLYILFLSSVDTVLFGTNNNKAFLYVPRVLGALSILLFPLFTEVAKTKRLRIHLPDIFSLTIMTAIMSASGIVNGEAAETYLSRVLWVVMGYVIAHTFSREQFLSCFDRFLFPIAIVSLITEVLTYIAPSILRALPQIVNSSRYTFYVFLIGSISADNLAKKFNRANAIFWEPGAYAIYLIFGIMVQLFALKKINGRHVIVYMVALFFTFSTTGYLALAVLLVAFVVSSHSDNLSKQWKRAFILLAFAIAGFAGILDYNAINDLVFAKLTNGTSGATTRYSSLYNGIRLALDHPLLGVGSNTRLLMTDYVRTSKYTNGGNSITNTVVAQFTSYGFIFGMFFLVGTLRFLRKSSMSTREWLLLSLTVMMAYSGERFFSFLPFTFAFYGLSKERTLQNEDFGNQRITVRQPGRNYARNFKGIS